ncbi:hypothetical protein EAG_15828 [Camponotus floridanus]|uniref:Uncharacterized protein n=1 Tax=Camponotus floridanus TaxID=104421 RepID=E2AUH6_CAMFO|nr:hypothetical protein EAG_15828 [Camponotus floridanus]
MRLLRCGSAVKDEEENRSKSVVPTGNRYQPHRTNVSERCTKIFRRRTGESRLTPTIRDKIRMQRGEDEQQRGDVCSLQRRTRPRPLEILSSSAVNREVGSFPSSEVNRALKTTTTFSLFRVVHILFKIEFQIVHLFFTFILEWRSFDNIARSRKKKEAEDGGAKRDGELGQQPISAIIPADNTAVFSIFSSRRAARRGGECRGKWRTRGDDYVEPLSRRSPIHLYEEDAPQLSDIESFRCRPPLDTLRRHVYEILTNDASLLLLLAEILLKQPCIDLDRHCCRVNHISRRTGDIKTETGNLVKHCVVSRLTPDLPAKIHRREERRIEFINNIRQMSYFNLKSRVEFLGHIRDAGPSRYLARLVRGGGRGLIVLDRLGMGGCTRNVIASALILQFVVFLLIQDSMSPDETSFRESSSSLSRMSFYLFLLCCAEDLPLLPSVCYGMHGGPETGNTTAGLENLRT